MLCVGVHAKERRFALSPRWISLLIVVGASFDAISTFSPWGSTMRTYMFLPWSPTLGLGQNVLSFPPTLEFTIVSVTIKIAAVLAWIGVVLHEYVERLGRLHLMPYCVIFVSSILSFVAVALFAQTGWLFSFGPYLASFGGICKALGVITEKLEVEVVLNQGKAKPRK